MAIDGTKIIDSDTGHDIYNQITIQQGVWGFYLSDTYHIIKDILEE